MKSPRDDKITVLAMDPACKTTPLNTRPSSFSFKLSNEPTLRAAVAIVRSLIRDTGGLRRCNSQSDTS